MSDVSPYILIQPAQLPHHHHRRPTSTASSSGASPGPSDDMALQTATGLARGIADSGGFTEGTLDTARRATESAGTQLTSSTLGGIADAMIRPGRKALHTVPSSGNGALSYAKILGLQDDASDAASRADNRAQLKPGTVVDNVRSHGLTPKRYAKEVLWESNVSDIKNIRENVGGGVARLAGAGLMGLNIVKTTKNGYEDAKAKYDDGTLSGKLKTYGVTAATTVTKTAKSLATWEIAGLGFQIGSRILPALAMGSVTIPVAGIALGAIMAATVGHNLDKLIPDPPKPPDSDNKPDNPFAKAFSNSQSA